MKLCVIVSLVLTFLLTYSENVDAGRKKQWRTLEQFAAEGSPPQASSSRSRPPPKKQMTRQISDAEKSYQNDIKDYQRLYDHYLPFLEFLETRGYFPEIDNVYQIYNGYPSSNLKKFYNENPPSSINTRNSKNMRKKMVAMISKTYTDLVSVTFIDPKSVGAKKFGEKVLELCGKIQQCRECSPNYKNLMVLRGSLDLAFTRLRGVAARNSQFQTICPGEDALSGDEDLRQR